MRKSRLDELRADNERFVENRWGQAGYALLQFNRRTQTGDRYAFELRLKHMLEADAMAVGPITERGIALAVRVALVNGLGRARLERRLSVAPITPETVFMHECPTVRLAHLMVAG